MSSRSSRKSTKTKVYKPVKYSSETYCAEMVLHNPGTTQGANAYLKAPVVPMVNGVLGTRKIKNITIKFLVEECTYHHTAGDADVRGMITWALVYVPEGTTPADFTWGNNNNLASLYEPNQNIIMSGFADSKQPVVAKTRLARNLNSGDTIALIIMDNNYCIVVGETNDTSLAVQINYAICF